MTTFAPITFPYLEKTIFKSVARVNDDSPDTHRFRLADDDVLPDFVADDALPPLDELVPVFDDEESATHSRTPYGILNWFLVFWFFVSIL